MAAPSLGHAIGLDVKRKDIFGPASQQLSENLAQWSAKKERAAKEKKDEEDKFWDQVMEAQKLPMNQRVKAKYDQSITKLRSDLKTALDQGDTKAARETMINFLDEQTDYRQLSGDYDEAQKTFFNDNYANPKVAEKLFGTDKDLSAKELQILSAFGYGFDPGTGKLLPSPSQRKSSFEYLKDIPVDQDALIAAQAKEANLQKEYETQRSAKKAELEKAKKTELGVKKLDKATIKAIDAEVDKLIPKPETLVKSSTYVAKGAPGYQAAAFSIQTPTKAMYSELVDLTLTMDGAVENALVEWEQRNPNVDMYDKIETIRNDVKAKDNIDISFDEAARLLAKEHYMSDDIFKTWEKDNSAAIGLNKNASNSRGSSSGSKTDEVEGVSDITYQAHWSNKGFAKQKTGWVGKAGELYEMKKKGEIYGDVIAGYGPTVEFTGGPSGEVYSIAGLGNINPVSLYYDIDTGKFRLSYNTTITSSGLTIPADQKDAELTKEQLNQVRGALATNMQKKIAAFDAALANDGYPTTLQAAGGGAPAGSTGGGFSWRSFSPKK
jgi:hypothetical protein